MWCHIAHLYPTTKNKNSVSKYKINENKVNYDGISFPVTLDQIAKIENQNKINFNIFTFDENEKYIIPLHITKNSYEKTCDMLLVFELVDDDDKNHIM